MRAHVLVLTLLVALISNSDWPYYGGGPNQNRYSPLTQITPANVRSLRVAWTYDTNDAFKGSEMRVSRSWRTAFCMRHRPSCASSR